MKIQSSKRILALFLPSFFVPFLSNAQEIPLENQASTLIDFWLFLALGAIAFYGIIKMWNGQRQTNRN